MSTETESPLTIPAKAPRKRPFLESPTKCAVWEDWMVVCAVRYEPVSLLFGQYQGDTKSPRSARRPVVFHFLGKFENRETQRASIGANREMSLPIQVRKSSERPSAQLTVWAGLIPKRTSDRRGLLNGKVRNVLVSRSVPTESRVLAPFHPSL